MSLTGIKKEHKIPLVREISSEVAGCVRYSIVGDKITVRISRAGCGTISLSGTVTKTRKLADTLLGLYEEIVDICDMEEW